MKITLAKALNLKNRLVGQISRLQLQIAENNRIKEGREFKFDNKILFEKYLNTVNVLISLKANLAKQNVEIYDKIYSIAEFKSMITFLQTQIATTDIEERTIHGGYTKEDKIEEIKYLVAITEQDKLTKITELEQKISQFQDEISYYNNTTFIEVDDNIEKL